MDKITLTELAKTYFDTPEHHDHLPLLKHHSSKPLLEASLSAPSANKHPSALSVLSLRRLLKN
jgi:hypothetical protein